MSRKVNRDIRYPNGCDDQVLKVVKGRHIASVGAGDGRGGGLSNLSLQIMFLKSTYKKVYYQTVGPFFETERKIKVNTRK